MSRHSRSLLTLIRPRMLLSVSVMNSLFWKRIRMFSKSRDTVIIPGIIIIILKIIIEPVIVILSKVGHSIITIEAKKN